ncbi:hypothetical protein [uncultured Shewanella sp.]|uniref:hypothetical protein n=1 Tax=uncultured Shewanella sp. TaxID=173975 RepID=UPI0026092969|nr:hypothetical protein [uncultured Shewanella sp.]
MSILQSIWLCLTGKTKPAQQKKHHQNQSGFSNEQVYNKTALILDIHENQVQAQPYLVIAIHGDMFKFSFNPLFIGQLNRISPLQLIDKISSHACIHVICGTEDNITKAYLSERYVTKLTQAGKHVRYDGIEGDHAIFMHPFCISCSD